MRCVPNTLSLCQGPPTQDHQEYTYGKKIGYIAQCNKGNNTQCETGGDISLRAYYKGLNIGVGLQLNDLGWFSGRIPLMSITWYQKVVIFLCLVILIDCILKERGLDQS